MVLHDEEFAYFNEKIVTLITGLVETLSSEKVNEKVDAIMLETGVTYEYGGK